MVTWLPCGLVPTARFARAPRPVRGPPLRLLTTITSPTKLSVLLVENVIALPASAHVKKDTQVQLAKEVSALTPAMDTELASLLHRSQMISLTTLTMAVPPHSSLFQTVTKIVITALVPRTLVHNTIMHGMLHVLRVANVIQDTVAQTAH